MLINIEKELQLDAVERQVIEQKVSALFGSLALLYAKNVWQGKRSLSSLHENYQKVVPLIHDYVREHYYQQIMQ